MGQGAGNLQTELIAHYMNKNFNKKYSLESILNICDTLEKFRKNEIKMWDIHQLDLFQQLMKQPISMQLQ